LDNALINYRVSRASKEQADYITANFNKNPNAKNFTIVFVAVDDEENIVGYLIAEEKTVPPPINGTDWFIWNIFSRPDLRRQSIGSALLMETIKQAEQENIKHLLGSCTNTPAHLFWLRHGFSFQKYGQKLDNGNIPHMVFHRLDKSGKQNAKTTENYRIVRAGEKQLDNIFNEYIFEKSIPLFKDKKDDIFGFTAVDEYNKVVGFITACPDDIGTPIDDMQWLVPYIFVEAEHQRKGIGTALLNEMIKAARDENIFQLGLIRLDENTISFLYNNDFDICVWYIMGGDAKPVSAAIRV
jgi:GNAT superfamily N-acetyltransferase